MPGDKPDPLRRRGDENPPVIEAMCRLQWAVPMRWDPTTPGQVNERVRDVYPAEPKVQSSLRADLAPGAEVAFQLTAGPQQQFVFGTSPATAYWSLPRTLSPPTASHLTRSGRHCSVVSTAGFNSSTTYRRPVTASRSVGLRFINRITIDEQRWDFPDYVNLDLKLPDGIPPDVSSFFQRTEIPYPGENTVLALNWATVLPDTPGTCAFVHAGLRPPTGCADRSEGGEGDLDGPEDERGSGLRSPDHGETEGVLCRGQLVQSRG